MKPKAPTKKQLAAARAKARTKKLKPKATRQCLLSRVIDIHGLSRKDVAEAVGRTSSWLSKVTAGTVTVSVTDAVAIVEVLQRASGVKPSRPVGKQPGFNDPMRYYVDTFWSKDGLVAA